MTNLYSPIRIVFADDHEVLREGFHIMMKKQQDIELVGDAKNGERLIMVTRQLKPDIVITDIKMPRMSGIEATKEILKEFPATGVIAFSMFDEESLIVDMLKAGASGYLLKNSSKEEIITAIKAVHKGGVFYCNQTERILSTLKVRENIAPEFSEQEIAIIKMICDESSNREIAEKFGLSKRTIESHRVKIMEKTNAKNIAGIVLYAIKNKMYEFNK